MTRLFDSPDPNPRKILEVGIAQAMPLWMEGLDEKTRAIWIHTRRWNRTGSGTELELVALVMAQVSLELFQEPGETQQEAVEGVREYAGDYLRRVIRHGHDFSSNVRELGDEIARDYSLCITIHANIRGGDWYVLSTPKEVEHELGRFKENPVFTRFIERFKERYPVISARLTHAADWEVTVDEIVQDIYTKYDAVWDEVYGAPA